MTQAAPLPAPTQVMQDREGNLVSVPVDQVRDAYASGALGFADGVPVHVAGSDGAIRQVSGAEAGKLFGSVEGLQTRTAGAVDYAAQEERKRYESAGQIAGTVAEGAARGLSFGLSDAALAAAGADTAKRQMYNPGVALGSELGGALLPLVFSGGSSGAATGASLGARGAVGAARGAEGALALARGAEVAGAAREASILARGGNALTAPARAVSEGAGWLGGLAERGAVGMGAAEGGLLARATRAGVTGAAEGAVYGAGQALGDASLKNEPITIEKIMAGAGHGALFGGGLGAGVVGAGATLSKAGGLLSRAAEGGVTGAEGVIARLARKDPAAGEGFLAKTLRGTSEEAAIRSLGGTQKQIGKVEQLIERSGDDAAQAAMRSRVRDVILDEVPLALGKSKGAILTEAERSAGMAAWMEQAGARKGALVEQIQAAGLKPNLTAFEAKAEELADAASRQFGGKHTAERIRDAAAEYTRAVASQGGDFKALDKARQQFWNEFDPGKSKVLGDARKKLYGELHAETSRIAEPLGKEFHATWKHALKDYEIAATLKPMAEKGVERFGANRIGGMSEHINMGVGAGVGAVIGGAPLAAALGLAQGVGARLVKRFGDNALAVAARGAAEGNLLSSLRTAADSRMGEGVSKFLGQAAGRTKNIDVHPLVQSLRHGQERSADREKAFAERRAQMASALGNPDGVRTILATTLQHAPPDLVEGMAQHKLNAEAFLKSKDPTPAQPEGTLTPHVSKLRVSPVEQARFLRYVRAVDDPLSVLDDIRGGKLSREGVEALQATSPALFGELQGHVIASLADRKVPLSYQEETALSVLLGIPSARAPKDLAQYQAAITSPPAPNEGGPPPSRGGSLNLGAGLASKTTQIEGGTQ